LTGVFAVGLALALVLALGSMNISAKVQYACIAVLELAARYGTDRPVQVRRIADAHGIPPQFLVHILLQLKGAGLVTSTRGAAGGYQLVPHPSEVTLGEVMQLVEAQTLEVSASVADATPASRVLMQSWQEVADVQRQMLERISFADLLELSRQQNQDMYYI
jgi:Rrf2 family protein